MPRAGLTPDRVTAEAEVVADEIGLDSLTLAVVARRLGVQLPSLYKHVDGLEALRREVGTRAVADLADTMARSAVGRSGADALASLSAAYRGWARQHPGRYAAIQRAPDPSDTVRAAAAVAVVQIVLDVLAGFGLHGADAIDATRCWRASIHGFVALEAAGGFGLPNDIDRTFDRLVASLALAFSRWPAAAPTRPA